MTKETPFTPLDSSVLAGMHYDPATSRLTLKFASGDVHEYSDFPMEKAEALRGNASPGAYFAAKIRGLYSGKKL